MEEIWKDIPGYEGYYQVSNQGNFRSLPRIIAYKKYGTRLYPGKSLLKDRAYDGYDRIVLSKEGKKTLFPAHRLVALTFIPNPENKPFINHINGCKHDNRVENLEWCTASENMRHADRTGLRDMSKSNPSNSKKVLCIETGIVYLSIEKALKSVNRGRTSHSNIIDKIRKQVLVYGYHWKFID